MVFRRVLRPQTDRRNNEARRVLLVWAPLHFIFLKQQETGLIEKVAVDGPDRDEDGDGDRER